MNGKWNKGRYFDDLGIRVNYGVKEELVPLCRIPDIGKVRANKLWAAGIKSAKDILANTDRVASVLGFTAEHVAELCKRIKNFNVS
jgi:helicase